MPDICLAVATCPLLRCLLVTLSSYHEDIFSIASSPSLPFITTPAWLRCHAIITPLRLRCLPACHVIGYLHTLYVSLRLLLPLTAIKAHTYTYALLTLRVEAEEAPLHRLQAT